MASFSSSDRVDRSDRSGPFDRLDRFDAASSEADAALGLDDPVLARSFTTREVGADGAPVAVAHFLLAGLHCAACASVVEAALRGEDGVVDAVVHGAGRHATVRFDPRATKPSLLVARIERAGYRAAPDAAEPARALRRREHRRALWQLFVAAFCAMQVMMYAAAFYGADVPTGEMRTLLVWASWLLSLPVVAFAAAPLLRAAWVGVRARRVAMELPVAIGIVATFAASSWSAFAHTSGETWFDSLTMFVAFLLGARWLASAAHGRVAAALESALERLPQSARRVDADGRAQAVPLHALRRGDRVRVLRGEAFPADGPLVAGTTEVDESLLSGESRGVTRTVDDDVLAGSVNLGAVVEQRVAALDADTRHAQIAALLRTAGASRPRLLHTADRLAGPFLAGVIVVAALAGGAWLLVDAERALWVAVAVLIVTCPCALSLAAPAALLAASGTLARRGILVARIDALEALATIDRVSFDKTGTLTDDRVELAGVRVHEPATARGFDEPALRSIAASLAAASTHPCSRAIVAGNETVTERAAPSATMTTPSWHSLREEVGSGIEAIDRTGRRWRLGAPRWAAPMQATAAAPMASTEAHSQCAVEPAATEHASHPGAESAATEHASHAGAESAATGRASHRAAGPASPTVVLADDEGLLASFAFVESLRDDAARSVRALADAGIAVSLLSGDAPERVAAIAARLGIADARGGLVPEAKLAAVADWQARGGRVAMVGDGLNDAPVLSRADVSFAMGAGSALARTSADLVLVADRLDDIVIARDVARRAMRIVKQNLAWAIAYNALAVPLAVAGLFPAWAAGLGMAASSLAVVGNALRIERVRRRRAAGGRPEHETPLDSGRTATLREVPT